MQNLIRSLLSGAAFSVLAAAPAMSQQSYRAPLVVTALHAGRVVNKANHRRFHCLPHISCSYTAFTSVPASDYGKKVQLLSTFYKFNNSGDLCSDALKTTIVAPKKSRYAKISTGSITYPEGCTGQQPTFYGDYYKLTDKSGFGKADQFFSFLRGRIQVNGNRYKARLILDVEVAIGAD